MRDSVAVEVIVRYHIRNHAVQSQQRSVVLRRGERFRGSPWRAGHSRSTVSRDQDIWMPGGVRRIQRARGVGKSYRRRPVRGPKALMGGVLIAGAGIPSEGNRRPELHGMFPFGPGEIVQKIILTTLARVP